MLDNKYKINYIIIIERAANPKQKRGEHYENN